MIKIKCEKCHKELKQLGALIFSPPAEINNDEWVIPDKEVLKFHICLSCYSLLCDWLEQKETN